jgi:hypothetical protein
VTAKIPLSTMCAVSRPASPLTSLPRAAISANFIPGVWANSTTSRSRACYFRWSMPGKAVQLEHHPPRVPSQLGSRRFGVGCCRKEAPSERAHVENLPACHMLLIVSFTKDSQLCVTVFLREGEHHWGKIVGYERSVAGLLVVLC